MANPFWCAQNALKIPLIFPSFLKFKPYTYMNLNMLKGQQYDSLQIMMQANSMSKWSSSLVTFSILSHRKELCINIFHYMHIPAPFQLTEKTYKKFMNRLTTCPNGPVYVTLAILSHREMGCALRGTSHDFPCLGTPMKKSRFTYDLHTLFTYYM